jgi:RNA polymerase sigma-70 factor (ECF subfamily)
VKSRLHRARLALRSALAPHVETPGHSAAPVRTAVPAARCSDTPLLVSRFLEGELTAARCAQLSAHVEDCADCTAACGSLRAAIGACRAWGRGPVPPEVRDRVRDAIRLAVSADWSVAPRGARA